MPSRIQVSKDVQHAAQLTVQTWIDCVTRLLHMRTTAKSSDHVPHVVAESLLELWDHSWYAVPPCAKRVSIK